MHANRNQRALRNVEKGVMKANGTRNIFMILAIILTTFMITTVFSLGINYGENMKLTSVRTAGTSADIFLNKPTSRQVEDIRGLSYVDTAGIQYRVGAVTERNSEGRQLQIALMNYDQTEWDAHFKEAISDIHGEYPKEENEIMLSGDALKQLSIESPVIGMTINLNYGDKYGDKTEDFVLCGYFRSYTGSGMGFLSDKYIENRGYTLQEDGILALSVDKMPDALYQIQKDIQVNEGQSFSGSAALKNTSASTYMMAVLLVLFIIGSGYLLIYNVMYISISKDIRFYGLLKTIGTSPSQIRQLVRRQAGTFACIGIPIGIILAYLVSFAIVPAFLDRGFERGQSSMDAVVFFHPAIFVLSIIFSAVTVWIGCNSSAKMASKISPVEALHYHNFSGTKQSRQSTNGGKLSVMAFHNVFRDRKRALLVFASLFMGTVTILGVNGIIDSLRGENYIKAYMDYDFQFKDIQFQQAEVFEKEVPQFDAQFIQQISELDGISDVVVDAAVWAGISFDPEVFDAGLRIQYEDSKYKSHGLPYEQMISDLKDISQQGDFGCYVATIDERYIKRYNETHVDQIDMAAFDRGETLIVGMDSDYVAPNKTFIGKTLTLTADTPDGTAVPFVAGGSFKFQDYEENTVTGRRKYTGAIPEVIFVSPAGMERLTKSPLIVNIGINVSDGDQLVRVDEKLKSISRTLTGDKYMYISSMNKLNEWNAMYYSLAIIGNAAALLLIIIGLMNFVNVMLTGVVTRRNEFAVMESIGTSKKQIKKILMAEGGIYALIATLLMMTLGNAFLMLVASAVPNLADYARFEYPFVLVAILILAIFVICLSVPPMIYKLTSKETIIERLHDFES